MSWDFFEPENNSSGSEWTWEGLGALNAIGSIQSWEPWRHPLGGQNEITRDLLRQIREEFPGHLKSAVLNGKIPGTGLTLDDIEQSFAAEELGYLQDPDTIAILRHLILTAGISDVLKEGCLLGLQHSNESSERVYDCIRSVIESSDSPALRECAETALTVLF